MIYLARDGAQLGQFSLDQVNALMAEGRVVPSDLAWMEGMAEWVPVSGIEGVQTASLAVTTQGPQASSHTVYAPPRAAIGPAGMAGSAVSPGTITALRETRPWVLFLSILGMIGVGLMILGALSIFLFGGLTSIPSAGTTGGAGAGALFAGLGFFYLVISLLYLYPIIKLFKYAGAISRLTRSGQVADLEEALRQQKSFWKFFGILFLVVMAIYLIILVVGVAGVFTAVKSGSP